MSGLSSNIMVFVWWASHSEGVRALWRSVILTYVLCAQQCNKCTQTNISCFSCFYFVLILKNAIYVYLLNSYAHVIYTHSHPIGQIIHALCSAALFLCNFYCWFLEKRSEFPVKYVYVRCKIWFARKERLQKFWIFVSCLININLPNCCGCRICSLTFMSHVVFWLRFFCSVVITAAHTLLNILIMFIGN